MISLYHLSSRYQDLLDLSDQAGDEVSDKAFEDTLAALDGEIDQKADRCAAVMATMLAESDALDNEEKRLKARREALLARRKRLADYVIDCLKMAKMEKVRGERFTVSWQLNPPKVVVDDEALVPEGFWKMERKLSKEDVQAALKAGKEVPGCHMERGESLRCR